jgi:hypothetical protein
MVRVDGDSRRALAAPLTVDDSCIPAKSGSLSERDQDASRRYIAAFLAITGDAAFRTQRGYTCVAMLLGQVMGDARGRGYRKNGNWHPRPDKDGHGARAVKEGSSLATGGRIAAFCVGRVPGHEGTESGGVTRIQRSEVIVATCVYGARVTPPLGSKSGGVTRPVVSGECRSAPPLSVLLNPSFFAASKDFFHVALVIRASVFALRAARIRSQGQH